MIITFATITYVLIQISQMDVIFTHLELWVAAARHNFKRVKNETI